jgi:hypothetical protein
MRYKVITAIAATAMAAGASLGPAQATTAQFEAAVSATTPFYDPVQGAYFSTLGSAIDFAGALAAYIQGSTIGGGFLDVWTEFGTAAQTVFKSDFGWSVSLSLLNVSSDHKTGTVDIGSGNLLGWPYGLASYAPAVTPENSNPNINTEFLITGFTAPVPGPIAGAGLPALLGLAGFLAWRRKSAGSVLESLRT